MLFWAVNIDGTDDNTEWKSENEKGKMGVKYIKMRAAGIDRTKDQQLVSCHTRYLW